MSKTAFLSRACPSVPIFEVGFNLIYNGRSPFLHGRTRRGTNLSTWSDVTGRRRYGRPMTGEPGSSAVQRVVVVFTALAIETAEVLGQLDESTTTVETLNDQAVSVGSFTASDQTRWRVHVIETGAGNIDIASLTTQAITAIRPDAVFLVGIAGALKDLTVGDVVAGTEIAWTERGKAGDSGYQPRIITASSSIALTSWARRAVSQGVWRSRAQEAQGSQAIVAQIASGEKVIADTEQRTRLTRLFSDAVAVEMEGYGFARTASNFQMNGIVVRGISDAADPHKSDDDQRLAANHAAAFAFEVLDGYSSALVVDQSANAASGGEFEATAAADPEDAAPTETVPASGSTLVEDLATDPDLLEDDEQAVVAFGRGLVDESQTDWLRDLLPTLASEVTANESPLLRRRLIWLGRAVIRFSPAQPPDESLGLESMVKQHPLGASLILTDSIVWTLCAPITRRRILTSLIGPSDVPWAPSRESAQLLVPLWLDDLLTDTELARVESAFGLVTYQSLQEFDVPIELFVDRLIKDLDSGEFSLQNAAARFIYRSEPAAFEGLSNQAERSLGAAIVHASGGYASSNGANEALEFSNVVSWSLPRLMGGFFAGVTNSSFRELRATPSRHLTSIIAAATTRGYLQEIVSTATDELNSHRDNSHKSVRNSLAADIEEISKRMAGEDATALDTFAMWVQSEGDRSDES